MFTLIVGESVIAACSDTVSPVPNKITSTTTPSPIPSPTIASTDTPTIPPAFTPTPSTSPTRTKSGNGNGKSDPNFADVGTVASFAGSDQQPKSITLSSAKEGVEETAFIVKTGDQYLAISDLCTHQGCEVSWDTSSKVFECPCHGSQYDIQGNNISGPAPRPLNRFKTKIVNGNLMVSYKSSKTSS